MTHANSKEIIKSRFRRFLSVCCNKTGQNGPFHTSLFNLFFLPAQKKGYPPPFRRKIGDPPPFVRRATSLTLSFERLLSNSDLQRVDTQCCCFLVPLCQTFLFHCRCSNYVDFEYFIYGKSHLSMKSTQDI
jgi:hypothetical protein